MESINKKQCTLCSKSDPQIISILSSIEQKLIRLLKKSTFFQHSQQQTQNNFHGFSRLIRVIFSNKFKHLKANNNCRHQQIKKFLAKKLKCSLNVLNFLCDQLAGIMGKFNFHIDVLIQQMKSFQRYLRPQKSQSSSNVIPLKEDNPNQIDRIVQNSQNQGSQEQKMQKKTKLQQNQCVISKSLPIFESYSQLQVGFIPNSFYPPVNYMWYYPNP